MSKNLILITRPAEGATELAAAIEARGHATLVEPMLALHSMPQHAMPVLEAAMGYRLQACIVTSRNALPVLLPYAELRNQPLYVVGEGTADAARHYGFNNIIHAPDVTMLLRRILSQCKPENGTLLYARGKHVAFNMAATLSRQGFSVEEAVVYHMSPATELTPALKEALTSHSVYAATFMSARTAEIFLELIQQASLTHALEQVRAIAFSQPIADILATRQWRRMTVCDHPSTECLLDTVDKCVAEG